jgi:carbonic anhydrase
MTTEAIHPVSPSAALERLREGNARFVRELRSLDAFGSRARREALVAGQSPFAIILSCSDSRVPSEIVFDCGLGDLFVVRVAGNVVAPSLVGSIEFAVATFGTRLVVVMGHTNCGAIAATLDVVEGASPPSPNLRDLVDRIAPSVAPVASRSRPRSDVLREATRANVRASVEKLRHASRILEDRVHDGRLVVVGAEYALETGTVELFEDASRAPS